MGKTLEDVVCFGWNSKSSVAEKKEEGSNSVKGEEVLSKMKTLGVSATLRTLQRYEAANLLPAAQRGWGEGGFGRFAQYEEAAVAEFYASYSLVHRYLWKVRFEDVLQVREVALQLEKNIWSRDELQAFIGQHDDKMAAVWYWLVNKARVEEDYMAEEKIGLTYALQKDGSMRRMITGPNAVSLVRFEIAVL